MVSGMSPSVTGAHPHGLRRLPVPAGVFTLLGRGFAVLEFLPREHGRRGQRGDERDPQQKAPPARPRRFDGHRGRALRDVVRFKGLVHSLKLTLSSRLARMNGQFKSSPRARRSSTWTVLCQRVAGRSCILVILAP